MLEVGRKLGFSLLARVTPEQLICNFFLSSSGFKSNPDRFGYLLQFVDVLKCMTDPSVTAENIVFYKGCQGHLFKDSINPTKEGPWVIDVFFQLCCALVPESHSSVDLFVLMSSPQ